MQLTATIRTRPAEGAKKGDSLAMEVLTETADDYDAALAQLDARVPDGWQKLSVRAH
ncbi:hypothetical protein [Aeromicrobium fastidiosum]|uniref:hypothetical protein n=1 Tax=Aeromicrobium fastidiosum TaxID=52699 RepID=UPI0016600698|nr:hypothetical protein [Aeromicrobium fastidiosum]MBP2391726.1 hypothetical protein [Aeromicrobium fastidiosum]